MMIILVEIHPFHDFRYIVDTVKMCEQIGWSRLQELQSGFREMGSGLSTTGNGFDACWNLGRIRDETLSGAASNKAGWYFTTSPPRIARP